MPVHLSEDRSNPPSVYESNPFKINTCKTASKQMTLTIFRMNTSRAAYRKAAPICITRVESVCWNGASGQPGTAGVEEHGGMGNTGNTQLAAHGRQRFHLTEYWY